MAADNFFFFFLKSEIHFSSAFHVFFLSKKKKKKKKNQKKKKIGGGPQKGSGRGRCFFSLKKKVLGGFDLKKKNISIYTPAPKKKRAGR